MSSKISVESNCVEAIALFAKIKNRMKDMRDALIFAGEEVKNSISDNFDAEGRYSVVGSYIGGSNKWEEWSKTTKAIKEKQGRSDDKLLQASRRLINSITRSEPTNNSVTVGTNVSYAKIHQFGAKKGQYGTASQYINGHKRKSKTGLVFDVKGHTRRILNPIADIPARPFLAVHPDNLKRIEKKFADYILADVT